MLLPVLAFAIATFVGNDACRPCHAAITQTYEKTPMARSARPVGTTPVPAGSFRHDASGIEYRVDREGRVTMRDRLGRVTREQFDYVIGSGAAGFSYLIARDRFLFQAPITWYSQKARWAASPGYETNPTMPWDRAVDPSCLSCHASQLTHIYGSRNRYAEQPFRQNGIGCERCHGAGSEHVAGKAKMVRPASLTAERRDDVCRQCHLMGEARIPRQGRAFGQYRAGDRLGEFVSYFVFDDPDGARLRTTSHVEKFASSRCKQASGDRFWCGTCHDPHDVPADPVSWFRERCQTCHPSAAAKTSACPRTPNCIGCHMPKLPAVDAGHGAFTDHSISRRPVRSPLKRTSAEPWRLKPFSAADEGTRELGQAYLELFGRTGDPRQRDQAFRLIQLH